MKKPFRYWRQYISSFLIFALLVSQTIHISFFDSAEASIQQYRDIVSLFVDRETYTENRSKIMRYSADIQQELGSTRVNLIIVEPGIQPAKIAAANEKLYYEGDGEEGIVGHLVGTILIGNIPIPMVYTDTQSFPSVYPYVDFIDKKFLYDEKSGVYKIAPDTSDDTVLPEIWHGVINPAVGRTWNASEDISSIGNYLDKTHDFYTKKGVFTPSSEPPRVFYFDGFQEFKSIEEKTLFQYMLNIKNSENRAYSRYTKYLLQDINANIALFDSQNTESNDLIKEFGVNPGSGSMTEDTTKSIPDIQTKTIIESLLPEFHGIINKNTLSNELLYVHNAGRYSSGTTVRADLGAITMTTMDQMARSALYTANTALMNSIDATLQKNKYAKKIPIFDTLKKRMPVEMDGSTDYVQTSGYIYGFNEFSYQNYFFGTKSNNVSSTAQCSIARGSNVGSMEFGSPVLVEANTLYDVGLTQSHAKNLETDTKVLVDIHNDPAYACFTTASPVVPKTQSYWGDNSMISLATKISGGDIFAGFPSGTTFTGMTQPILSLSGMKETNRIAPASLRDCISRDYQYTLEDPNTVKYVHSNQRGEGGTTAECVKSNLSEWNISEGSLGCPEVVSSKAPKPLRYTCLSKPNTFSVDMDFADYLDRYKNTQCIVGTLSVNGNVILDSKKVCMKTYGAGDGQFQVDESIYESVTFHTIPSLLRHVSPNDDELRAAENTKITPSIPVDQVRYVEFLTPKGNIARIEYPNFFELKGTTLAEARAWIKEKSNEDWNRIILAENSKILDEKGKYANIFLEAGSLPANPIDWNTLVSDDTLLKVIQAKRWLTPEISERYKIAIEDVLSYSQGASGSILHPDKTPSIPRSQNSYEVAYLGLDTFPISKNTLVFANFSGGLYDRVRKEIQAYNISEAENRTPITPAPSDSCGPPEGVNIFQWPSAIMCWIKSLTPIKIVGMACGTNLIGAHSSVSLPIVAPPSDIQTSSGFSDFFTGGKLTYSLDRDAILPGESIQANFRFVKNAGQLVFPSGTQVRIDILAATDGDGKAILQNTIDKYLSISPNPTIITDNGAQFILAGKERTGTFRLRAIVIPPTNISGGASLPSIQSDIFTIKVQNEYLSITPSVDEKIQSFISATSALGPKMQIALKNTQGGNSLPSFPVSLNIVDDVSGQVVASGITVSQSDYIFGAPYTKTPGVYRLEFRDALGRSGNQTFSVVPGEIARANISPLSSAVIRGGNTPVFLRFQDGLGNPTSPDIHSVSLKVNGGYFVLDSGERRTELQIESSSAETSLVVGSDTVGTIEISGTIDQKIPVSSRLQVFDTPHIVLKRTADPQVGGSAVKAFIQVLDQDNNIISGFNSVAHVSVQLGGGSFGSDIVTITDGVSEEFDYTPGQLSGEQSVSISIPGIGTVSDISFSVNSGVPLYITHTLTDESVVFSLRDRYNNIVPVNLPGVLQSDNASQKDIQFQNGIYTEPRVSGTISIDVPALEQNILSYRDDSGVYTIQGMRYYGANIPALGIAGFDFHDDYNARYTVLAGGSFVREGEDILFHAQAGSSQSLAVTTLLASPYTELVPLSVRPGGGIVLSDLSDSALDTSVNLIGGFPQLSVQDTVSQSLIARIDYHPNNPLLRTCSDEECSQFGSSESSIYLEKQSDEFNIQQSGNLSIVGQNSNVLTVLKNGSIIHIPGVSLNLNTSLSQKASVFDVLFQGNLIAHLYYNISPNTSVKYTSTSSSNESGIIVHSLGDFQVQPYSFDALGSPVTGVRFIKKSDEKSVDNEKNTPSSIDSFGLADETPGIGWKGNNRTLLSYAAGDTVGEATRWFHTYTMVNLGDPVTHNDRGAPGTEKDGIDRTIGTQLARSGSDPIKSYKLADMNNDGYQDILIIRSSGAIELILNLGDRYRSKGVIAYIPDLAKSDITLGDFSHDGFSDILGLNSDGEFVLLINDNRKFVQKKLSLPFMSPPRGVTQYKVYDMDGDKQDDIVYISENGELAILYSTNTAGVFNKKVLNSSLGISLSQDPIHEGGALYANNIPQSFPQDTTSTGITAAQLYSEVYYPFTNNLASVESFTAFDVDTGTPDGINSVNNLGNEFDRNQQKYAVTDEGVQNTTSASTSTKYFVRSQYANIHNIDIQKTYTSKSSNTIHAGDAVEVRIAIKNNGSTTIRQGEYLDTIGTLFDSSETKTYTMLLSGSQVQRDFSKLGYSDFDASFSLLDIPAGQTLVLTYEVHILPVSYGDLLVGDFEKGETGEDIYGDVGFKTDTSCGGDMMLWRSVAVREYEQGTRTFSPSAIPDTIKSKFVDANKNGIPDSIDNITDDEKNKILDTLSPPAQDTRNSSLLRANLDPNSQILDIGFDESTISNVQNQVQSILDGLACGFGGGSCMSFPINWAPLAPGSAPVVFGYPLSLLTPATGVPLFSGLTGIPLYGAWGCFPIPTVFPSSPLGLSTTCTANLPGAGGILGPQDPLNAFRLYVTPTLTLGVGAAFCFGGAGIISGNIPPPALWPLVPGGNCIITTSALPLCKDDGSVADGDVRGISGLGSITDAWNAKSCTIQPALSTSNDPNLSNDIVSYFHSPDTKKLPDLYTRISNKPARNVSIGPFATIGAGGGNTKKIGLQLSTSNSPGKDSVVKMKNQRIDGFPDFIMNWVSRQTDELTNSLFTLPSLVILLPTTVGQNTQYDGTLSGFTNTFKKSYDSISMDAIKTKAGEAYDSVLQSDATQKSLEKRTTSGTSKPQSDIAKWMKEQEVSFEKTQDTAFRGELGKIATKGKGSIAAMRAAYKLIGKLPLISLSEKTVVINVPWILPQELDKYSRSLDAYSRELNRSLETFCAKDPSQECLAKKASLQSGPFMSSLQQNLKRIEEYKNFPAKLQKYITWKQRYLSQILCYINEVQQMTTGWVYDNSIRFKKWAELIVLMRAIADSWQPILDIIAQKDAQCSVCRNERYNAKYLKYKLLGSLLPSLPVIKFPRWPDIILDLHDVRFGIVLSVPNFEFNLRPIRLPALPQVTLPSGPNVGLTLPTLDVIPPLPNLPDLPSLPAIPTIKLPNLPPPPKIPKIFAALSVALKILKLMKLMECYVNKTALVPEWTAGDVIAQRTERQGTLSIDFLNISLPQISLAAIREIRVSSHVNFELRSDFITEFARSAVKPINNFNTDLGRGIPNKVGSDIRIDSPSNINLDLRSAVTPDTVTAMIHELESESHTLMDVDNFYAYLSRELESHPEFSAISDKLALQVQKSHQEADLVTQEISKYNAQKFAKLREYIDEQYDQTAKLQNIVDALQSPDPHILSDMVHDRGLFVSDTHTDSTANLVQEFNTQFGSISDTDVGGTSFADQGLIHATENITKKVRRLAALTEQTSGGNTDSLPEGYSMTYQGIYIITDLGNQVRLFDYTDPLTGDEVSTKTDIDLDSDSDYLFLLDGNLFIKKTTFFNPVKQVDSTVHLQELTEDTPSAPDFFHEESSLSQKLSFSYSRTRSDESSWMIDMYDRYLEWDMISAGYHDDVLTPKSTIEIISPTSSTSRVSRTLDRVTDPIGFVLQGPKMEIVSAPSNFILSPGRTIYTGKREVKVQISTGSVSATRILSPFSQYSYPELLNVSLVSGTIYIPYPTLTDQTYSYSDDMIGMPILPNMRISSGMGEVTLRDHIQDTKIVIDAGGTYMQEESSPIGDNYSVEVPYKNGFYYPKIRNTNRVSTTQAGEILFSPRATSDVSAPEIEFPSELRMPVYQNKVFAFDQYITESSSYSISIDPDSTQDTNKNGIFDDDFVTTATGMSISDKNVTFGKFDTIGKKEMMLRVQDQYGNTSFSKFVIDVYAPVPTIQSYDPIISNTYGKIDESLTGEPIHVFRVRQGSDIERITDTPISTAGSGSFAASLTGSSEKVSLVYSDMSIPFGKNGIIPSILPTGYVARVQLATSEKPLHINLLDSLGRNIYTQRMIVPDNVSIQSGDHYTDGHSGLFVLPGSRYKMIMASIQDPSIPAGAYLVDATNHPVIGLGKDGNIYPLIPAITATYEQKDDFPVIRLQIGTDTIAQIIYRFDFFYTLK